MTESVRNEAIQPPEIHIRGVAWGDVPQTVTEGFVYASAAAQSRPDGADNPRFERPLLVKVAGNAGVRTYAAREIRTLPDTGEEVWVTQVIDASEDGATIIGRGELWYRQSDEAPSYEKDRPCVNFTSTARAFRQQGLARRRLFVMNALAREQYGQGLYSDTGFETFGEHPWQRLVAQGLAESYVETNGRTRYRSL